MTTLQNAVGHLERVYVRSPRHVPHDAWQRYGWHGVADLARAEGEHEAFREALGSEGATVVCGSTPVPGDPDAIYAFDPTLPTDRGLILLRPGKAGRRAEPEALATDLADEGHHVLGSLTTPATAEGGDMVWLDERTLLVGRGYRTNDDGIAQVGALLGPDIDVERFDLPHFRGPDECLHLMSFISLLDHDLAVVFAPMVPVRLLDTLRDHGVELVGVPEDEFASQGPNVLALGPRIALALEGNPETRRRMEAAGVDVRTYAGDEISRKGDGGPTCLTRPLERSAMPGRGYAPR